MLQKSENNHLLLLFSIAGLTYFLYLPSSWTYIIIIPFLLVKNILPIKIQLQIISVLALFASFLPVPYFSELLSVCALGLALNIGTKINSKWRISTIYFAQSLGITMKAWVNAITQKTELSSDIILLFFALPSLFMSQSSGDDEKDRSLWILSPFFDKSWTYSLGMMLGIFLPFIQYKKHLKFLIVALIILIQIFVEDNFYQPLFSFARGIFIFDQTKHQCELIFLLGYILVDFLFNSLRLNYMLMGYIVMSIYIWQKDKKDRREERQAYPPLLEQRPISRNQYKNQ